METIDTIDVEELLGEIQRYLAVVEAFRAAGCDVGGPRTPEKEQG
jgi:hypothetical protein